MARAELRLPDNVPGDFFVDETCIDCDACRRIAPASFDRRREQSAVVMQPRTAAEIHAAERALLSCPTASIGTDERHDLRASIDSFPTVIDDEVHFCGFTSESSFGAFSYLVVRDRGNLLVDSPRYNKPLVRRIEALGGVDRMILSHIDDVADHQKFADHFGCDRVMHRGDVPASLADLEVQPDGDAPVELDQDLLMIPTPGHTRGHVVYLYRQKYLFTGDHLAWDRKGNRLYAFRNATWYSWEEQIRSMEKLLDYSFEWVLPGHGAWIRLERDEMKRELEKTVRWMGKKQPLAPSVVSR